MCGIAGLSSDRGISNPRRTAAALSSALSHRGPDGEGFLTISSDLPVRRFDHAEDIPDSPNVATLLVHRRLSIIDLDTGAQPMSLRDGHVWIIFNGEIYNYPQLRTELVEVEQEDFRTSSDTEVILRVYRRWGVHGFRRLNGMFAFAIYDHSRRCLVLARDPVGVKPLYWSRGTQGFVFGSEMRAFTVVDAAGAVLSPEALLQFLYYRFVPSPLTLCRGIYKVVPGHALTFDLNGNVQSDVDFAAPVPVLRQSADWGAELAPQVVAAVRRQMISDVPIGALLSGGLDSSLVVAAMKTATSSPPTFAVGFSDDSERPSELRAARDAAKALGTDHYELELEAAGYFERLPWALQQVEEPLAHSGMLLQADLARLARSKVKVVLTGQGADELLGGYPRHQAARLLPLFAGVLGGIAKSRVFDGISLRREVVARIRRVISSPPGVDRMAALFSPLAPSDAAALVRGSWAGDARDITVSGIEGWWNRSAGLDDVARFLYIDTRTSLADDLLLVADKMAMAHSLEARVPFLDLDYLSVVESIAGPQRVAFFRRKRLQRTTAWRILPKALWAKLEGSTRTLSPKRGFEVPVSEWFRGPMRGRLVQELTGADSLLFEYLNPEPVNRIVSSFLEGSGRSYRLILALYALSCWLRSNPRQTPADPRLAA
jgi:asparagine synthase (glutamine-hydrolysing)